MAKSIDVCEIQGCTNVPQKGETICSFCWDAHDNRNIPGFPDEFDFDDVGNCNTCLKPCFGYICNECEIQEIKFCKKQEDAMLEVMQNELTDPMLDFLDPDNTEDCRLAQPAKTALPKYCYRGGESIDPDDCLYGDMD